MLPIWSDESARLIIRPFVLDDLDAAAPILDESFGTSPREERGEWLRWQVMNYTALARLYQPPYGDRAIVLKATGSLIGSVGIVPSFAPFEKLPYWQQQLSSTNRNAVTRRGVAAPFSTTEIGLFWAVSAPQRGKGYATEAAQVVIDYLFREWHLKRVVATTEYDNAASVAVMRRLGMSIERNPDEMPSWFQVVGVLENRG